MDNDISEFDFWNMTIAELERLLESKKRVSKRQAQEKATYDYILADLIGRSVSRLYNSSNHYPDISEIYPTLFDSKEYIEKQTARKAEISSIRFRQFANSFNNRHKEGAKDK